MTYRRAFAKAICHVATYCGLSVASLFALSGDWNWMEGWAFVALLAGFMVSAFVPLAANPYLLKARVAPPFLPGQSASDKAIFGLLSALHLAWLAALGAHKYLPGWDRPFDGALVTLGAGLFILAIIGIQRVVRDNPFLVPAVGYQPGQRIISNGIYSRVRHPMYSTMVAMSLGGAFLTSSMLGIAVTAMLALAFWRRAVLEERFLASSFPEYGEYMRRVKYRFFPMLI